MTYPMYQWQHRKIGLTNEAPTPSSLAARARDWDEAGAWPDDWNRWEHALNDMLPWHQQIDITDL